MCVKVVCVCVFVLVLTHQFISRVARSSFRVHQVSQLSLSEVNLIPGAIHKLNILEDATFCTKILPRLFNPDQQAFMGAKVDEMLAGDNTPYTPRRCQVHCTFSTGPEGPQEHRPLFRRAQS